MTHLEAYFAEACKSLIIDFLYLRDRTAQVQLRGFPDGDDLSSTVTRLVSQLQGYDSEDKELAVKWLTDYIFIVPGKQKASDLLAHLHQHIESLDGWRKARKPNAEIATIGSQLTSCLLFTVSISRIALCFISELECPTLKTTTSSRPLKQSLF